MMFWYVLINFLFNAEFARKSYHDSFDPLHGRSGRSRRSYSDHESWCNCLLRNIFIFKTSFWLIFIRASRRNTERYLYLFFPFYIDTGYELTIVKTEDNSSAITQLIKTALPNASVLNDTNSQVVYKLPLMETRRFPAMFKSLESAITRLRIESVGLTATTLEHVFLK